jgi:RsiW-degrading membrane proteinase PrsW (M82 family)
LGIFLGWLTLRSQSIWPAVIGHAAINGIAGAAILLTTGQPNPLLGPLPVGIIGSLGYALVTIAIFVFPNALKE